MPDQLGDGASSIAESWRTRMWCPAERVPNDAFGGGSGHVLEDSVVTVSEDESAGAGSRVRK